MNRAELERLRAFAEEPPRTAMSRSIRMPSPATRILSLEQELERTRAALREALGALEAHVK